MWPCQGRSLGTYLLTSRMQWAIEEVSESGVVLVPSSGHISIEGIERWPEEELGPGLTALSLGENSKAAIGSVERAGALVHRPVRACGTIFLSPLPHPR